MGDKKVAECVMQALLVACMMVRSLCAAVDDGYLEPAELHATLSRSVAARGTGMTAASTQMVTSTDKYGLEQLHMGLCFYSL